MGGGKPLCSHQTPKALFNISILLASSILQKILKSSSENVSGNIRDACKNAMNTLGNCKKQQQQQQQQKNNNKKTNMQPLYSKLFSIAKRLKS